jgi:hypothetical protein
MGIVTLTMSSHDHPRRKSAWPAALLFLCLGAVVITAYPQTPQANDSAGAPSVTVKPDAKKAKLAFQDGQAAEKKQDWLTAYEDYGQAVEYAPGNKNYAIRREAVKSALVQSHIDAAERDAISERLDDARRELLIAKDLDPANTVIRERLAEFLAAAMPAPKAGPQLTGDVHLDFQKGKRNFNYRGDTRGLYDEVARQFGVEASFDPAFVDRTVNLTLSDVDFSTAMSAAGEITGTFWRPLTPHVFFVAQDTPQKRKDFSPVDVRTVLLPASESSEQMTEDLRVLRDLTGITQATLNAGSHTITLRATPQALYVASNLIDAMEQPLGEMVLEVEVLEVDKNYARQLGITPPETVRSYTLSPSQIQQAQESPTNLVSIISQVFGLPTSLSGLSPTQIAGLLATGGLSAGAVIPPLVAFGGGESTFLATLPGATANFSEMLSLVKHGIRVFLRTEDGQPATAFFGEQFPVSLASYSSSLGGVSIPGVASANFPTTNYNAGGAPQFVTSAILRTSSAVNDLIVANQNSGNVGVFLGNEDTGDEGDGTFAAQVTYATDPANVNSQPMWIATGDLNGDGVPDLIVANKASDNVGILLGSPAGDGTFQAATTVATGNSPVSVVAAHFFGTGDLDMAVANQGDNSIFVFKGNGDGTFITPATTVLQLPNGYEPAALLAVDVNADGHADLIVADQGNNSVSVFLSNGDGTFQPRHDYDTGQSPVAVAAADLNADGIIDLAVANNGVATTTNSGDSVSILLGQQDTVTGVANGIFAPGTTRDYPAGTAPTSIVIGDFNVDGLPDLAVVDGNTIATGATGNNAVSILIGGGDGTFSSNFELPVQTNPQSIVTADFNDDSKPDIAVANAGSNTMTVILNSSSVFNGSNGGTASSGTPYPNVQYVDLGLKMKATPRIHANDEVTLNLEFTINGLSTQTYNSIPALNNESLTHTVTLKQDQTSMIASFMEPQSSVGINGTPGVAGVPGIGFLGQDQTVGDQNTELVILVTPRMVRRADRANREVYAGLGALQGAGAAAPSVSAPQPLQPDTGGVPLEGQPGLGQPAGGPPGAIPPGTVITNGPQPGSALPPDQTPPPVQQPAPPPDQNQAPPPDQNPAPLLPQNPAENQNQPQPAPAPPAIE